MLYLINLMISDATFLVVNICWGGSTLKICSMFQLLYVSAILPITVSFSYKSIYNLHYVGFKF